MKKIIIYSIVIFLTVTLLVGCSKGGPQPSASSQPNPQRSPVAGLPPSPTPAEKSVPDNISMSLQEGLPLKVIQPSDAATINADSVTIKGQTKPGATLNIDDELGVADADGNFSITISLNEGPNAIDIIATDGSGKEGEVLLLVNSVLPETVAAGSTSSAADYSQGNLLLKVIQPADASTINTDTVTVKGQTVPGATVCVNDETDVADANGNFSITVTLESGLNAIDIIAFDDNGNDGEVVLLVNVVT